LNRRGGKNFQDEYSTENWRIFWGVHLALPIGEVIAERKICTALPIRQAVAC
jgi:hypothetical protein